MPHAVIFTPLSLDEIAARFRPRRVNLGDVRLNYSEAFRSLGDGKLLVETYIKEPSFDQQICVAVRPRSKGDMVIDVSGIGFPRPTRGLHLAVEHLVAWIQSLSPGTVIVGHTLITDE